eukprot:407727-Pleurochrysis_carterae.AAC.1
MSRIGKNKRGGSGLVKKSAKLSALRTKGTVMSKDPTFRARKNGDDQYASSVDGAPGCRPGRWLTYCPWQAK